MKQMLAIAALFGSVSAAAYDDPFKDIRTYNRDAYSRDFTDCDRLARHPSDPESVKEGGWTSSTMDKPAAIEACLKDVAADPENPRLNYQLARAYGYSGMHEEGDKYRMKALMAGYPQSLFVVGYIKITGWDGKEPQPCYGGELVRRSAHAGRFAGLVGFPHYALTGKFDSCTDYPKIDKSEMQGFLDKAKEHGGDYYQGILIDQLINDLKAVK